MARRLGPGALAVALLAACSDVVAPEAAPPADTAFVAAPSMEEGGMTMEGIAAELELLGVDARELREWCSVEGKSVFRREVHVALVPTRVGHEVPAWLAYGGWNDCPPPEEHVAVMRSWNERFGAEVAVMSGDTVELVGVRPPQGRAALRALATEQFHYCPDTVFQGTETMDALAASLDGSSAWGFWWD